MKKFKKCFCFVLAVLLMFFTLPISDLTINANAASSMNTTYRNSKGYELAVFPIGGDFHVTQLWNGSYTHSNQLAIDCLPLTSTGGIKEPAKMYAPFTGKIVATIPSWGCVVFQSNAPVQYADGTVDIMTVVFGHDNNSENYKKNQTIAQGNELCAFGRAGGSDYHTHIFVIKGTWEAWSNGGYKNAGQISSASGGGNVIPTDAFFFDSDWSIDWTQTSKSCYYPQNKVNWTELKTFTSNTLIQDYFDCHCILEVTGNDKGVMNMPCSKETDPTSTRRATVNNGDRLEAIRLILNTKQNYWYEVITPSGARGFIYAGNVKWVDHPEINHSGITVPANHTYKDVFNLTGSVSTSYNILKEVSVYVYPGTKTSGTQETGGYATVNGNYYALSNPATDYATKFDTLSVGQHTYVVTATIEYTCAKDGKTKEIINYSKPIYTKTFKVEDSHSHSYSSHYEADHPHRVYNKCSCGDWYYTGATTSVSSCSQCNPAESSTLVFPDNGGIYKIASGVGNNMYLDFACTNDNVQIYENCDNHSDPAFVISQYYKITHVGDGWHSIINIGNGKAMDVDGGNSASGTNIHQWAYDGNNAQLFRFYDAGDGYCYIKSKLGCYVDVQNGDSVNNTNVWTYSFNGSNAQKWNLIKHLHYYTAEITTPATCSSNGIRTYTCRQCKHSHDETIYATDHSYSSSITKQPTCTKEGVRTFTCSACGHSYTEAIAKKGHSWNAATCTAPKTCASCGTTEGSALGHNFVSEIITEATCTTVGVEQKTCTRCGELEIYYIDSPGHNYSSVVTPPTCTEYGYTTYTCLNCGDSYTWEREFPAHTIVNGSCSVCGESTVYSSGTCGKNLTWILDFQGTLTISGEGDMLDFRGMGSIPPWEMNSNLIKAIIVEDGITSIGEKAFFSFYPELSSITMADSVTDIGASAFYGNKALDKVVLGKNVKSVGDYAFFSCTALTSVTISNSIANIGESVFSGCSSLTDVYYSGTEEEWDNIVFGNDNEELLNANIHYNCHITPDDHDYVAVVTAPTCTEQGFTTYSCICGSAYITDMVREKGHDYKEVIIYPTCTTDGNVNYVCNACGERLPGNKMPALGHKYFDTVTTVPTCIEGGIRTYTCSRCDSNYSETIPFVGHTLGAAATCTTDQICTVCGEVLTEKLGHDYNAVVTAPTCTEDGYTTYTCLVCGNGYSGDFVDAEGHSYSSEVTTAPTCEEAGVETFICTKCNDSYTKEISAYGHTMGKWYVSIEPTLTEYGEEKRVCTQCDYSETKVIDMANTFTESGYKYKVIDGEAHIIEAPQTIANLVVPEKLGGYTVVSVNGFSSLGNDYLKSVVLPDTVTEIGANAFLRCFNLTNVKLSSNLITIGAYAFDMCTNLETIVLPETVETIGDMAFGYCKSFKEFIIPKSVKTLGRYAFMFCTSLESIELPETLVNLGSHLFFGCSNLKNVFIPDTITYLYDQTFHSCSSLESIVLPKNLTSVSMQMFALCENLKEVTLYNTTKIISAYAFSDCDSLQDVFYHGTLNEFNRISYGSNNEDFRNANIHIMHTPENAEVVSTTEICGSGGITTFSCECGYIWSEKTTGYGHENVVIDNAVEATCSKTGLTEGKHCDACGEVIVSQKTISKLAHTEEIIPAVMATCSKTGLSEGKNCSVCGEILVKQTETAKLSHDYKSVVTAPTCTTSGYTTHTCSVCGYSHTDSETSSLGHTGGTTNCEDKAICTVCGEAYGEVNADNHKNVVTDNAVSATCTTTGLTEGSHCEACGKVIVAQTTTEKLLHTEVKLPAVAATCTQTGLTEGKKCSVCGEVLVAQVVIDKTSHKPTMVGEKAATATQDGYTGDTVCATCGLMIEEGKVIPATGDSSGSGRCGHLCHKDGILGFFWKILRLFFKLFQINPVCECGAAHY